MKIAVSVWEDKVSPVFDTASRLLILDVERNRETSRFETYLDEQTLIRKCSRIRGLEVEVLICGAISRYFQTILTTSGITVIPWICGTAKEVVEGYLEGTPLYSRFLMPGCNRKNGETCKRGKLIRRDNKRVED